MEEKRTLIETFLPIDEISAEAKKEKLGAAKPPTFELHYWWTRKPLSVSRATALASCLPEDYDISEYKRLLGLGKEKRAHNYSPSNDQIKVLKNKYYEVWNTKTPLIFDPFAGGGSIPFESLRIGLDVSSNDYNPVAYLIQKATIGYPSEYGYKLLNDVKKALNWLLLKLNGQLGQFYPKHNNKEVAAYIYSWVVPCPDCGFENPLVGQWWLVRKKNKRLFLEPNIHEGKLTFQIKSGKSAPEGTVIRGNVKCLNCGNIIPKSIVKDDILQNEREILLAVVLNGKNGKEYDLPNDDDLKAINDAEDFLNENWDKFILEDLIPIEEMPDDNRGSIWAKPYLKYWYKLLNKRQLILFSTIISLIREYVGNLENITDDNYKESIAVFLSIILAKHITYNCRSTHWHRTVEAINNVLVMRGIAMLWDHTEVNPFVKSSGTLLTNINAILRSLEYSIEKLYPKDNVLIQNSSITQISGKSDIVITDPPYFDDVVYAELSELFYVFEKRALMNVIELPLETPKYEDLSVGGNRNKEQFEHLFNLSCQQLNNILRDDGLLVMYFAHSSVEAWDFVVNALRTAEFRITATWPIHTENTNNPLARGNASIMSSIIIVARKEKVAKSGFIEEIKDEMENYLKIRFNEFWNYGLRGADITVAAMGATLDILTQYKEIKSFSGEMTVKDILELVETYVVDYILEKFLKDSESLDSQSRFYIYCRLSELDVMSFDTANLISKSLNIDLKMIENTGLIKSITKGRMKGIKLQKYFERDIVEIKEIIDAVQVAMSAYDQGGMREFESVLSDFQFSQSEIYNILESFKYLESGDPERKIAMQILGKSDDLIPEKGQTTLE